MYFGVIWYLTIGFVLSYFVLGRTYEEFYKEDSEYRLLLDSLNANPKVRLLCVGVFTVLWLPAVVCVIPLAYQETKAEREREKKLKKPDKKD